ncbi:MAG: tRNA lysidine(34) synthetase TilS [Treponema sp.]|jgi:tRNA(Ile)-lysidine synthase|nr:tRNA lysidine(34) synthetase TilS [Treponema sp.]
MALLTALCSLRHNNLLRATAIYCLHVEHALRPAEESCGDAEFVRTFCKEQEIECYIEHLPPGKIADYAKRRGTGIEAAARHFRHRAFRKHSAQLGEKTIILLAHTKDDLLETALMRVLRGVGPAGLAAMPQKRGRLLRPLLSMTRADVTGYLKAKNISWREDSTNTDLKFLRNRVRHQIVPLLNESFPSWKAGLSAMAQTQRLVADFLSKEAQMRVCWEQKDGNFVTDAENFFAQDEIVREEALFQGINALPHASTSSVPKRAVIRRFCEGEITAADLGAVRVKVETGTVSLSRIYKDFSESGYSMLIEE